VAFARAQVAVLAEEQRDQAIGRGVELEHGTQQFGGQVQEGVRVHRVIIVSTPGQEALKTGSARKPAFWARLRH